MKNKIIFALILALGLTSCGNSPQKADDKANDKAETKQEELLNHLFSAFNPVL